MATTNTTRIGEPETIKIKDAIIGQHYVIGPREETDLRNRLFIRIDTYTIIFLDNGSAMNIKLKIRDEIKDQEVILVGHIDFFYKL